MKRLYLSDTDKKIAGVCGGLAEYMEVDSTLIRVGWIVLTIFTAVVPGILAYLLMAIIMPHKPIHE
ncbi:MAG TPA: PspC domain-containing protein [Candidatus Saccharimonadales bacterium]|nr:PspC domain-containing protein [Candidatus Saccharimonadales bacterium]